VFKIGTKLERNRTISGWVINDLAIFFKGRTSKLYSCRESGSNCIKFGERSPIITVPDALPLFQ